MDNLNLTIQLKRLGKKKIKKIDFLIKKQPSTLHQLINACVKAEVRTYNDKRINTELLSFLSAKDIGQQSKFGKVGFADIKNQTLVIQQQAIDNATQGFNDGLFVVFINDEEIKSLQQTITINNQSVIAFIRMTFLTGAYW